jgi:hypothetical protein
MCREWQNEYSRCNLKTLPHGQNLAGACTGGRTIYSFKNRLTNLLFLLGQVWEDVVLSDGTHVNFLKRFYDCQTEVAVRELQVRSRTK